VVLPAALLVLVLGHDAVAAGGLRPLVRFEDRLELVVDPGRTNLLSDSAVAELKRWPGLVALELHPPLTPAQARQLRKLERLAVRLGANDPSLRLLGPALVRRLPPPTMGGPGPGPCPGTTLTPAAGDAPPELRVTGPVGECLPRALAERLDLKAEGPSEPPPAPPEPPAAPPKRPSPHRAKKPPAP
jgi:hypothetical protein